MSDKEIVKYLIERDEHVTRRFFHGTCRPLLLCIMRRVFSYPVEYDEMVNEIYLLLMEDDARRLRQFDFRSSLCQWIKTVALRHFVNKRSRMIEDVSKESPYNTENAHVCEAAADSSARVDIGSLLEQMRYRRYAHVIRKLVLEDCPPQAVADEMGVSVDNLYNIKKRALSALALQVAADKRHYNYE